MVVSYLLNLIKLSRLDTCLLISSTVFVPLLVHTGDPWFSFTQAIPLLPMSMSAFILNDIHDVEKDKINHAERIIPSGKITLKIATLYYLLLLITSLYLIKLYIPQGHIYWYLLLLFFYINYNYVVNDFPSYKNIYVSITSAILICLLSHVLLTPKIGLLAMSVFLFILGREILMDTLDMNGDGETLARRLGIETSTSIAIFCQAAGIGILMLLVDTIKEAVAEVLIIIIFALTYYRWKKGLKKRLMINMMKVQMLIGIVFLFP